MPIVINRDQMSNVETFDSPEAYADYLEQLPLDIRSREYSYGSHYSDNYRDEKFKCAIKGLRYGDIELAEQAEKFMNELKHEGLLSIGLPMPSRAVVGATTILPLYEAGIPNCMVTRDMSNLRGRNAPLNVYWDRFRSAAVSNTKFIIKRGIAITAFVMAMSTIRPVNLYMISCSNPNNADWSERGIFGSIVRVETKPLDLARATWMFTNSEWSSHLTWMGVRHRFHEATGKTADWMVGPMHLRMLPDSDEYAQEHREVLDMSKDDIFIYGMHRDDTLSWTDPVAWVKQMIEKHAYKQKETE